ncbi:MAG: sensor histidine kinase [Telluria sp.]
MFLVPHGSRPLKLLRIEGWALAAVVLLLGLRLGGWPTQLGADTLPAWAHTILEVFSVSVAALLFAVVWSLRRDGVHPDLQPLGAAALGVGLLALLHLLMLQVRSSGAPDRGAAVACSLLADAWLAAAVVLAALRRGRPLAACGLPCMSLVSIGYVFLAWWGVFEAGWRPLLPAWAAVLARARGGAALLWAPRARAGDEVAMLWFGTAVGLALTQLCFLVALEGGAGAALLGHAVKAAVYLLLYLGAMGLLVRTPLRQLGALAAQQQQAREDDRRRIARELHDELGQALTALRLQLERLRLQQPRGAEFEQAVDGMLHVVGSTVDTVRGIAEDLRPGMLDDLGLAAAIEQCAAAFSARVGIPCELALESTPEPLREGVAIALYRILQEALTNIARHAGARRAWVGLRRDGDELELTVDDDGRWQIPADARSRLGLLGMRERAQLLGGSVETGPRPDGGTRVRARVPIHSRENP